MSSWSEKVGEVEAKMGLVSIPNTPRCARCKYYDDYYEVCLLLVRISKILQPLLGIFFLHNLPGADDFEQTSSVTCDTQI